MGQFAGDDSAYFLGDALGSVRQLADSTGAVTLAKSYTPYGETLNSNGDGQTAYGFTGEMQENGLVYLRARYYQGDGRFLTRDTWKGNKFHPLTFNKWIYVEGNPINFVDPTGHASRIDDDGNSKECPANTCYISLVGSTPGLPYYSGGTETYGENVENSSSGGGSMDAGRDTLPDVKESGLTVKGQNNLGKLEPSAAASAPAIAVDAFTWWRNVVSVETYPTKINVFAFYKVVPGGYSVQSLDVQNPGGGDVTVSDVAFDSGQIMYNAIPGPGIHPVNGYYGFPPVVKGGGTTNVSLIPSGFTGNLSNVFCNIKNITMTVRLRETLTGGKYKHIQGELK